MQLSSTGGGGGGAELVWSADLSQMLKPGRHADPVAALDMAVIGAGPDVPEAAVPTLQKSSTNSSACLVSATSIMRWAE